MRNDYETRAKRFINSFFADFHMPNIRKVTYCTQYVKDYNMAYKRNVKFEYGYTRFVFITSDYVIKMDYFKSQFGLCCDEVRTYEQAKKDHMEYLFAKITPYEFNGNVYYIMPKVTGINEDRDEEIEDLLTEDEYCYVFEDLHLQDLHRGNFGVKNGQVTIIDYACS